jgi:hypothetical protein
MRRYVEARVVPATPPAVTPEVAPAPSTDDTGGSPAPVAAPAGPAAPATPTGE